MSCSIVDGMALKEIIQPEVPSTLSNFVHCGFFVFAFHLRRQLRAVMLAPAVMVFLDREGRPVGQGRSPAGDNEWAAIQHHRAIF